MKTIFRTGALACATLVLASLLTPALSRADAIPVEQSADQTKTLSASQSTFYKEFDAFVNAATPMPVMEISRRISKKVDEEPVRLAIALSWAKDKISVKDFAKVNSLFFLIYSDMAQRSALTVPKGSAYYMAYSKGAYQALVTFELMFQADAARCTNPAAAAPARALINPRYENLKYVEDAASPEDMETYWKTALNYEAAAVTRPGNAEICSNGVAEAMAAAAGEPTTDRVDPNFVDDAKWAAARDKVRASLSDQWKRDYASVRKAWEARKALQDQKQAAAEAAKQARAQADAAKKAAEAEKQKADDEKLAREKQERLETQKHEASKYHDTFTPDTSSQPMESGGGE